MKIVNVKLNKSFKRGLALLCQTRGSQVLGQIQILNEKFVGISSCVNSKVSVLVSTRGKFMSSLVKQKQQGKGELVSLITNV